MKVYGDFILHSGDKSNVLYDVGKVITNPEFIKQFRTFIEHQKFLVGIEFGGAMLAALSGKPFGIVRKDGTVYGDIPDTYTLIDDVITTGASIDAAIDSIGKEPSKICCIVNRSEHKIESMWDVNPNLPDD